MRCSVKRGLGLGWRRRQRAPPAARLQSDAKTGSSSTHFGYQSVDAEAKKGMVGGVFSSVASSYDVMNDLMSAGVHRIWKDDFVQMMRLEAMLKAGGSPPRLLDVAGGTGDITFRVIEKIRPWLEANQSSGNSSGSGTQEVWPDGANQESREPIVTVSDINPEMLEVGRQRAQAKFPPALLPAMEWRQVDAEAVSFDDATFDLYTIAFGLRNVTDIKLALREAYRVLKPGGRFMCLEFSHVNCAPIKAAYDAYSFNVIPVVGEVVAKDRAAYQYLVESIRMFPKQEELKGMMSEAGFHVVTHTDFTFGVVAVHSGFKPL
ncbi:unnamed protein product [Chrysoparadoxa australica]